MVELMQDRGRHYKGLEDHGCQPAGSQPWEPAAEQPRGREAHLEDHGEA